MRSIPNVITAFRILITPLLAFCIFQQTYSFSILSCILFSLGAVSDFVDGYVARAIKMQSRLGRHLDPFADKIFILGTFIPLAWIYPQHVPWWAVGLILLRDVLITGLRGHAESGGYLLPTIRIAKAKTVVQMTFLGCVLLILTLQYLPSTSLFVTELLQGRLIYASMIFVVLITFLTGLSYIKTYREITNKI